MRIFVAGATGVVGRRVVPLLLEAGHAVTAVGRDPGRLEQLTRLGARALAVNLLDPPGVRRAVEGAEAIVNLATAVPPLGVGMLLPHAWRPMDRVRREASRNLVDAALAGVTVRRFIQESFAPVYLPAGDGWVDESSPVRTAAYNHSVLEAECQAEWINRAGRIGVMLRFGLFYGPDDAATAALIGAVRKGLFPLFGRPEAYASWTAFDDTASAVVAALEVPAGVYNVVEDEPMRRRHLADGLARLLGVRPPRFLPEWTIPIGGVVGPTIARSLRISNRKLREASGWAPRYRTALEGFAAVIGSGEPSGRAI